MKEVFEALYNRIKSPVFGYFILAFIVFNWKILFYLFFSASPVLERFKYFDDNSKTSSLLINPLIAGIVGAITYPWINFLFIWLARMPNELKEKLQTTSDNKILILKQEFEESRSKLLATKEKELISRAKRDEEVKSLPDDQLREDLQQQLEQLRRELGDDNSRTSKRLLPGPDLIAIYMELARLYEKKGDIMKAEKYMTAAAHLRENG